jgi:hypothetical protein
MGCASSRELGVEEKAIVYAEGGLNFSKISAVEVDTVFRRNNCNGVIMQAHLIQMSNQLGFRILNSGCHMHVQGFYQTLKSAQGTYSIKDLLLLAILLSKGRADTKSRLIYEVFDPLCTHQLDISEVKKEILIRMLTLAANNLPKLVCSEQVASEAEMKIHKYIAKLLDTVDLALEQICEMLTIRGKIISQDTFVEVFSNFQYGQLVTTTGLRTFLLDTRAKHPRKYGRSSTLSQGSVSELPEPVKTA